MRSIVNIVRSRLRHGAGRTPTEHPDANLLTGFIENTLPQRERAHVLGHLAECADCREYVALASSTAVSESTGKHARRLSPVWGWVAAAAAATCLVVVTLHRDVAVSRARVQNNTVPLAIRTSPADRGGPAREMVTSTPVPKRKRRVGQPIQRQVAAAKQEPVPEQAAPVTPSEVVTQTMEPQVVGGTIPAPAPPASNFLTGSGRSISTDNVRAFAVAQKTLKAPTGLSALWSIDASGALQKSMDGGKTWQIVHVADGGTALQGAILTVNATIAQVRVTTNSGEEWISEDAGVSWRRVKPLRIR